MRCRDPLDDADDVVRLLRLLPEIDGRAPVRRAGAPWRRSSGDRGAGAAVAVKSSPLRRRGTNVLSSSASAVAPWVGTSAGGSVVAPMRRDEDYRWRASARRQGAEWLCRDLGDAQQASRRPRRFLRRRSCALTFPHVPPRGVLDLLWRRGGRRRRSVAMLRHIVELLDRTARPLRSLRGTGDEAGSPPLLDPVRALRPYAPYGDVPPSSRPAAGGSPGGVVCDGRGSGSAKFVSVETVPDST